MMTEQLSTHTKPTPKSDDFYKHQVLTVTKNSAHDDKGMSKHLPPCGGQWVNALNDDANTHIKAPTPCLHLVETAQHAQHLT